MIALVTGGASSGKSAYAEQLACSLPGNRYYLAAMKPYGEEGARRIARHRALRADKGFTTIECFDGLGDNLRFERDDSLESGSTALLESLGNVVANELFADDWSCVPYEEALQTVLDGVAHVAGLFDNLVIVGDEVGGDGLRYDETTETYIRLMGSVSCAIAARCDLVVECVAGQPFIAKDDSSLKGTAPLNAF
ncbi:MAG: bifunctional adenosylcobinamide kinase/adenosylcobinamide-phosphate guanylyltransferase [Eggerthellaceae bacterium]|nr:bifunctional adenosylcobinamide kinase/adenosylcobinamide-phosphate guanylyltransferase [Eggerthellaceae bacterium]